MRIVVAGLLSRAGHDGTHVALECKGAHDDQVWQLVVAECALLITRGHRFADPARCDPGGCLGIIYLRKGNLKIAQEVELVGGFFERHVPDEYRGRLVTLSPHEMRSGGRVACRRRSSPRRHGTADARRCTPIRQQLFLPWGNRRPSASICG